MAQIINIMGINAIWKYPHILNIESISKTTYKISKIFNTMLSTTKMDKMNLNRLDRGEYLFGDKNPQ